jgi:peptidyl-dipeptidase A
MTSRTWKAMALAVAAAGSSLVEPLARGDGSNAGTGPGPTRGEPTVEEARAFLERAEKLLFDLNVKAGRAAWVQATHITFDTEILAAEASEVLTAASVELAQDAARFDGLALPEELARKLLLLKLALVLPAPADPEANAEVARLAAALQSAYGAGRYCRENGECLPIDQLERRMAEGRDEAELAELWAGWHRVGAPMRGDFQRLVELANRGASELGFADLGAMWRSKYDMPPDDFAGEVDRLWGQVRPLYEALHCHVRARLGEAYGTDAVPTAGPIPAHLLGNMWAQSWGNVFDLVAPEDADPGYDLTERLQAKGLAEREMVRYGERFFTSLGFAPLPETFWERSQFTRPRDREVVCHASAWDIDYLDDLRIKMCIGINDEDFRTIHHELGHNFYQRAYKDLPQLFRDSANDGFHEAVGDTIALSVTPGYLVEVGLLDAEPDPSKDVGLLLREALDKIAFLPFGLVIDQWRWKVFSGEVPPERYNAAWWELRRKYQGVVPPVARSEADFDPGAKYHVPGVVPYTRYFLAHILQFQFHRALCQAAGCEGPLHRGSIYGNRAAGDRLAAMLAMGQSRPWPEALEAIAGTRQMDATAILDYFAPLKSWLDEQNRGRTCGW